MSAAHTSSLRYAFGGMIGMAAAMGIGRFVYTPILPGMMQELGLSTAQAGLIAGANYLGYLVGALLGAGSWAHGRERPLMLAAVGVTALLCATMALTDSVAAFLAIRFVAGVASAFMMVFLATIVFSHLAAAGRSDLQALHFSGVGVGISVSSLMIGLLVVAEQPWTAGWLWSAVICAFCFVAVWLLVRDGPLGAANGVRETALPKSPALSRIIWSYGLFGFGYIVTATFLIAIVREGEGGRLFESAVWLVTGLAIPPSTFLWAMLARRFGITRIIAIGCIVEAVGVVASVSLGGHVGPLLAGLLLGGTFVAITALGLQVGRLLAPDAPRRALAIMTAAFGTGQIIGPVVAGYLTDITGSYVAASLLAALALVASSVLAWDCGRKAGLG